MEKKSIFEKIDAYFDNKKPSEVTMYLAIIAAVIGFIVYMYIFPSSEEFLNEKNVQLSDMTTKLTDEQTYITSVSMGSDDQFLIKQKQNENTNIQNTFNKSRSTNIYFDDKLKDLSYLLFDEKNWAGFLDRLAFLSNKYDVKIVQVANEFHEPTKEKIEHVLDITFKVDSNYNNLVKLINSIEESQLVVDIHELNITREKNLNGLMKIAVWGMEY